MKLSRSWASLRSSPYCHFFSIAIFLLLLFIIYFSPILFSNFFIVNDGGILDDFKVTQWTMNLFSGYPLLSDPTFYAFYPFKVIVYKVLKLGFNFFVISGYFLMAFFTYCYVYYLTKLKSPALLSAIIYSFSGYAIYEMGHATHFIHTICWMPLILLSFEKLKERFSLLWSMIGLLAIPTSIAAGFPQLSIAMLPVLICYALMTSFQNEKTLKQFGLYLVVIVGGYLIAAPIIGSSFLLSLFSDRAHLSWEFFCTYYVELKQLLLFFFPYLMGGFYKLFAAPIFGNWEIVGNHGFVGFFSFLLAAIGLWKCRPDLKSVAYFWAIFIFLSVLVSLGPEVSSFYKLLYKIPVVNNFRAPERYLFIFSFGISILAGFGLQAIQLGAVNTNFQKNIILWSSFLFACLLVTTVIILYPSLSREALSKAIHLKAWYKNPAVLIPILWMIAALVTLWLFLKFPQSTPAKMLVLLTACGELLFNAYFSYWHPSGAGWTKEQFFNPPAYLSFLRDDLNITKQRFLKMQMAQDTIGKYLWGNYPLYYNLPSAGGYAPLALQNYTDFLSIANYGAYLPQDLHNNQAINITGIKYLFTVANSPLNDQWFADTNQFKLRTVIGDTLVYENMHVLPRVWFTDKLVALPDQEMLQAIHTGKFADGSPFDPAHTALLKQPLEVDLAPDNTATATIEKMDNEKVIITTNTQKPQFLILSDVYYPGWKAYIDGKKNQIYQTDYVYRGILIPAGKHQVEFRYIPRHLYISYVLSGITFCLVSYFFYAYRRKLTRKNDGI
jgi:hypothetical protein